jgi:hypothetical protein
MFRGRRRIYAAMSVTKSGRWLRVYMKFAPEQPRWLDPGETGSPGGTCSMTSGSRAGHVAGAPGAFHRGGNPRSRAICNRA